MASLNVDFSDPIGRITPRFFGSGLEHVGANVYGGLWVGPESAAPNEQGWRSDVLNLARMLRPGVLRWPGGNFAQFYHWRDGVGPAVDRPDRFDYFWAKPEPNSVGTDEFLQLCLLVGAEASITVNSRTGTPTEAADWVEYCNGDISTAGGQRRSENGHPDPYNVRLWAIGSQSWEFGTDDAVRRYRAFARAMKNVDSSIQLIAVGGNPSNHDAWDRAVVKGIEQDLDLLGIWGYDGVTTTDSGHPLDVYYANNAGAERLLWAASNACQVITDEMPGRTDAGVFFDSWGFWRTSRQGLQHEYNLGDALAAATILNGLIRLSGRARGAAWGNLVNALGLIQATEKTCWTTPVYEALRLYRQYHGDEVSRSSVAGPAVDVPGGSAPIRPPRAAQNSLALLDVSATRDRGAGRFTLAVVNRSFDERIDVDLSIWGLPIGTGCTAYILTGEDVASTNTLAQPSNVKPYEVVLGLLGTSYSFPARSITIFVWEETPGLSVPSDTTIEEIAASATGVSELDSVIAPSDQDAISTLDSSDNLESVSFGRESSVDPDEALPITTDDPSGALGISVEDEIIAPSAREVVATMDSSDLLANESSQQDDRAPDEKSEQTIHARASGSDVGADPESALESPKSDQPATDLNELGGSVGIEKSDAAASPAKPHLDIDADPEGALEESEPDGPEKSNVENPLPSKVPTDRGAGPNPAAEGVGAVDIGTEGSSVSESGDKSASPVEPAIDAPGIDVPGPRQPGAPKA